MQQNRAPPMMQIPMQQMTMQMSMTQKQRPRLQQVQNTFSTNTFGGRNQKNAPGDGGGGGGNGRFRKIKANVKNPIKRFNNWNYCRSDGFDVESNHTSGCCPNPWHGHVMAETRTNPMGGSMKAQHKTQLPSQVGRICEEVRWLQRGAQNGFANNTGEFQQNQANNNGGIYKKNRRQNSRRGSQRQHQWPQNSQQQFCGYMQCQPTGY